MRMCRYCFFIFSLFAGCSASSEVLELDNELKEKLIQRVSNLLEERYVFPERGRVAMSELQRRWSTGYFDDIKDPRIFANRITGVLDVISDLHLWVNYHAVAIPDSYDSMSPDVEQRERDVALLRRRNFGIEKIERLPGNLGLLEIRDMFYERGASERTLAVAMEFLQNTDGLIIDLRRNGGGQPQMVQLLLSYFLVPGEPIATLHYRDSQKNREFRAHDSVAGPYYTSNRPVYVLTSEQTFSGAEALAYHLKVRERVTVVGERTSGGAHLYENIRLHEHFMMAVPVAYSVDLVSQADWQYIGVRPDLEVPASQALVDAQRLMLMQLIASSEDSHARREQEAVLGSNLLR